MCSPPAGKEMLLIATKYFANPWSGDSQFLCGIAFDFTDSVKKFSLVVVRTFLEPPTLTNTVNVTDQLSKEFSENIRVWITSIRIIKCTFLCLITTSTIKGTSVCEHVTSFVVICVFNNAITIDQIHAMLCL